MVRFTKDMHRYLTRKIGFEAVMRIRCTKGLSIHTFHGNFFVRSIDLLSLPNVNPDAGFGMQISIEDALTDSTSVCFQAALLYTSSKGERRIRVHTMCLPVTTSITDIYLGADQQAIMALITRMAVDRCSGSSVVDARDAFINVCSDIATSYSQHILSPSQRMGGLFLPDNLKLIPLYVLATLKNPAFRLGTSTKLDQRVFCLNEFKCKPMYYTMMSIYPHLYPIHNIGLLTDQHRGDAGVSIPEPPILQLSSASIDSHGVYLLDTGYYMILYVGRSVSDHYCKHLLGVNTFMEIQPMQHMCELPELDNDVSQLTRTFIGQLLSQRPFHAPTLIIRDDSKDRQLFLSHLYDDRSESTMSYHEFLQHIHKLVQGK